MKTVLMFIFLTSTCFAKIHNKTTRFIDVELDKNQFLIDCSDQLESGNSYIGFNLLDADTYYLFVYRRPLNPKMCKDAKSEYMKIVNTGQTVRLVGINPEESLITESKRKEKYPLGYLAPFKYAKKVISSIFIRLQSEHGACKAYFENDCELPKNYWAGLANEKK